MTIVWWGALLIALGAAVLGGVIGFIITRKVIQKQLRENPPINENQIRAMYRSMGRKPTETDIKKTMNAVKRGK
ncbi:YneF family protein [Spiroplasma endosymbiont of Atherix ibis]|uniref:YneF family protein n=1 Tax=Spiroplasma endosymbiont of Atherix ibis TaxID=3066291 RepID=UPI0030CE5138